MRRAAAPTFFLVVLVCVLPFLLGAGVVAQGADPLSPNAASSLYWVEWDSNQLRQGNADGSGNALNCLSVTADMSGLAIDSTAGKLYWVERDQGRLRSANLDCSGVTTLSSTLVNADRLALDVPAGKLYWTENNGTNRIRRANLNGTSIETVIGSLGRPVGIAVDTVNDFLYWTELDSRGVWRATLAGANKTMIVPPVDGQSTPLDIAVDPARNHIYWIVGEVGAIYMASLTGSSAGVWLDLANPRYVTVDVESGRVYWGDWDTREIRRANSDASNNQLLFSAADGVAQPRAIALSYSPIETCYTLTRSHAGQGSDPVASPNKSTGCAAGQYIAGEIITLTATPAAGWSVGGWSGTNNDASTATTNTVTMPENDHTISVIYQESAPPCYTLTRIHTGQGNNPVATPSKSTACGTGQYIEGENITLTATPAANWSVAGWSGTNNDASTATTNTVTMPAADRTVSVTYQETVTPCYTLTRTHTGQGNNPVATPTKSTECGTGQYIAGEVITLTATPAVNWSVAGWSGTNNDASAATTNTVTMPVGNHTVSVTYQETVLPCYTLTRTHTGQGNNPVATPSKSAECGTGQYVLGESISLTATPAVGWSVSGWSGTNNDASAATTNTVTMPGADHTVSVAYVSEPPPCYTLTRTHTGQGNNPVAAPALSAGCGTGQYVAGENITLTATPANGWYVTGWGGTNNDAGTATTNSVAMPSNNHTVSVVYEQEPPPCFALTRSHTGQGGDPVATPNKSAECGAGQYVAGELISLTATPDAGWRVAGWSGTSNDGSLSTSNNLVMPASGRAVQVTYMLVPPDEGRTVLPMILSVGFSEFSPFEVEPNNSAATANGRLLFGRNYQGYPNDMEDYFYFDVPAGQPQTLNISLDNITGTDPQLQLHFNGYPNRVDSDQAPPYRLHYVAPPGRYYVRVVVVGGYNTATAYVLRVEAEDAD